LDKSSALLTNELKPYDIVISGEALNTIIENRSLFSHFCFMVYYATSLIGYNLCSKQKA